MWKPSKKHLAKIKRSIKNKKKIIRWMRRNPYCYWCGIKVINRKIKKGKKTPDNYATVDHLHNKLSFVRLFNHKAVLSCNKCNLARGYKCNELFQSFLKNNQKISKSKFIKYLFFQKELLKLNIRDKK